MITGLLARGVDVLVVGPYRRTPGPRHDFDLRPEADRSSDCGHRPSVHADKAEKRRCSMTDETPWHLLKVEEVAERRSSGARTLQRLVGAGAIALCKIGKIAPGACG